MSSPAAPTDALVRRLLEAHHLGSPALSARVVEDLSPGLSAATILRVELGYGASWGRSVIVKISSLASGPPTGFRRQQGEARRECEVYCTGVVQALTDAVVAPALYAVDNLDDSLWLWLEDVSDRLQVRWDLQYAVRAVESIARLHSGGFPPPEPSVDWTSEEFDAFRHHVPHAVRQLEAVLDETEPQQRLLAAEDAKFGLQLLSGASRYAAELAAAPAVFQHGDFHIDNAGWLPDGRLLLIDWAQAGIAPIGADVAVFLSNYRARGGSLGSLDLSGFDELIVGAYARALISAGMAPEMVDTACRVIDLWSVSWAVQVRLGPGLAAAQNEEVPTNVRAQITQDIIEGLRRAREAVGRLAVGQRNVGRGR